MISKGQDLRFVLRKVLRISNIMEIKVGLKIKSIRKSKNQEKLAELIGKILIYFLYFSAMYLYTQNRIQVKDFDKHTLNFDKERRSHESRNQRKRTNDNNINSSLAYRSLIRVRAWVLPSPSLVFLF